MWIDGKIFGVVKEERFKDAIMNMWRVREDVRERIMIVRKTAYWREKRDI